MTKMEIAYLVIFIIICINEIVHGRIWVAVGCVCIVLAISIWGIIQEYK